MTNRLIWAAVIVAGALGGCGSNAKDAASGDEKAPIESGSTASKSFALTGFTGVGVSSSDDVVVRQGTAFSVVAKGPQSALDRLEIEVKGDMLSISRKSQMALWSNDGSAVITVTMPRLDTASLAGSGSLTVDKAEGDAVGVSLAGSGDLDIASLTAKSVELSLAGSGDISVAAGAATKGDFGIAGSGSIKAGGLVLTDAEIGISGSGDVDARASGTADISVMGSGDVTVTGGAKCTKSEMGSGEIRCS